MKISRQNILKINEEKSPLEMCGGRGQMQQHVQDNISRLRKVDFVSFYFLSHFYFFFDLFFILPIFKTLGLGLEVISHISHI